MSTAVPIIRQQGEGERMWFSGGGVFTWKATGEETGGALLMLEDRMERGKVTPLHVHPDQDEAIYVLDGEIVAHLEDAPQQRVGTGGLFFAPRGVPHAQRRMVPRSGRVLVLCQPAGFEGFVRELAEAERTGSLGPAAYERVSRRYGITWLEG